MIHLTVHLAKLRPGQRDSDSVRALQERLNRLTGAGLPVTGNYLDRTREVVRRWQRSIGDTGSADGKLGPRQFARLFPSPPYTRFLGDTPSGRALSDAGVRFIAEFEGFRGRLHNDPAGHCSIGFGHLVHKGRCNGSEPATFRAGIDRAAALKLLQADSAVAARAVNERVTVALNQPQFDALVSFTFNVGAANLARSALLRRLNSGEHAAVPAELAKWTRANGMQLPGLVTRRAREGRLFSTGDYG